VNTVWLGAHGADMAVLWSLFSHFAMLSLLAIGGAIATAPEMQRYLVAEKGWLDDGMFTDSVAIAQAAPGPNVLFVAVLGWNVAGLAGALAATVGSLLPSTTLALSATRWGDARRDSRAVRAFTAGLAPLTLGLLLATGWVLTEPSRSHPGAMLLVPLTVFGLLRTGLSPVWLVAGGALVGAFGWAG
jgi:chromate transporter